MMRTGSRFTKLLCLVLCIGFSLSLLGACNAATPTPTAGPTASPTPAEPVKITVMNTLTASNKQPTDAQMQYLKEKIGVEVTLVDYPAADGAYMTKLSTMLASNELPDLFVPWASGDSLVQTMIEQGAVAALDEYLPKYAAYTYEFLKDAWPVVKVSSTDNKIYYIPEYYDSADRGTWVRKDWLDKVGITKLPETQAEFVDMLKAFRDKDPNGNDKQDELPISARQNARFLVIPFEMYGVPWFDGGPAWDLVDGKVQYGPVTPQMKACLEFCKMLYDEKLLDPECFVNDSAKWHAKIQNDQVGVFSWVTGLIPSDWDPLLKVNPNADFVALPIPKVDGYEQVSLKKPIGPPWYMVSKKSESKMEAILKYVDVCNMTRSDPESEWYDAWKEPQFENIFYTKKDGKFLKGLIGDPNFELELWFLGCVGSQKTVEISTRDSVPNPTMAQFIIDTSNLYYKLNRVCVTTGMPETVFGDYADIKANTMAFEYITKIIIGEYPIEKFDEFVDKWNKSGGEQVTKNINEWYDKVKTLN